MGHPGRLVWGLLLAIFTSFLEECGPPRASCLGIQPTILPVVSKNVGHPGRLVWELLLAILQVLSKNVAHPGRLVWGFSLFPRLAGVCHETKRSSLTQHVRRRTSFGFRHPLRCIADRFAPRVRRTDARSDC